MEDNSTLTQTCVIAPSPYIEPRGSRVFRAVTMAIILVISLVENTIVCRVIYRGGGRKPLAQHLMSNLAIAELISTFFYPLVFHYESEPFSWVFGKFLCKLVNPILSCCNAAVTFTMAAIAVYRCFFMLRPYCQVLSRMARSVIITICWMWSISVVLPSTITREVLPVEVCNQVIQRCDEVFPSERSRHRYSIVFFIMQHVLPLVVMVGAYGIVSIKINQHICGAGHFDDQVEPRSSEQTQLSSPVVYNEGQIIYLPHEAGHSPPEAGDASDNRDHNTGDGTRPENTMRQREQELLKIIYAIILIYFLCYLPYSIMFVMQDLEIPLAWHQDYDYVIHFYSYLLRCLPSALHPMVYLVMRGIHRKELYKLVPRCFP